MTDGSGASAYPPTVQPGIPRLGDIPYGWTRSPIGKHLIEERRPIKMDDDQTYDLVTVKRARGGVVKRETLEGQNISVKTQFEIHQGDFLISKRQIVHGACGVVPKDLHGSTVSNEYSVLRVRPTIDLQFLKYLSHSVHFQQTCFHSSIGVHIEKMIFKLDQWFKWKFDLPPIEEQRRIAKILGTWDRAIEITEKLIATSEAQKKALMQQLLTGKKRLPGFEGAWRSEYFGELFDLKMGGTPSRRNPLFWETDESAGFPWVSISDLNESYISDTKERITSAGVQNSNVKLLPAGTVIFSFKLTIGKRGILTMPAYTNEAICALMPVTADEIHLDFLYHALAQMNLEGDVDQAIKGKTLNKQKIADLVFNFPSYEEQQAIVDVLNCSWKQQLNILQKLQTLKTEKAALMQQLLTGKRRVNTKEMAA